MIIVQKLKYGIKEPLQLAEQYFAIMSVVNNLELAKREIQLLAFTAVRGNIGSDTAKKEFVKIYDSSLATVGNIISKLSKNTKQKKTKLLLKKNKVTTVVHPALLLNFDSELILQITFEHVVE